MYSQNIGFKVLGYDKDRVDNFRIRDPLQLSVGALGATPMFLQRGVLDGARPNSKETYLTL